MFIIMNYLPFSLTVLFCLKEMSEINIATSAFLWLMFCMTYLFPLSYFKSFCSLVTCDLSII